MQGKPSETKRKAPPGIEVRHSRACATKDGGACTCSPTFRPWVYDKRTGQKIRPPEPFSGKGALSAAKGWRADALSKMNRGKSVARSKRTLREAAEAWLEGAKADPPTVLTRSGYPFKPSALRTYEADLQKYVLPELGDYRLSEIRRGDVQQFVDALNGGLAHSGSKVRNVIVPLRSVFRHAIRREEIDYNPTADLELPNGVGKRQRAETPAAFEAIITPLAIDDRELWSVAFYAGLRRGEIRGLRWEDVTLHSESPGGYIAVAQGWDDKEGPIAPKSRAGTRTVPIPTVLAQRLRGRMLRTGKRSGLVFGRSEGEAFTPSHIRRRAAKVWAAENEKRAERKLPPLEPLGLHESRHSWKTWLRSAGVSRELRDEFGGHSDASIGRLYEHTSEQDRARAIELMDAYLAAELDAARVKQPKR